MKMINRKTGEILEYNENNHLIYSKDSNGFEIWYTPNKDGKLINIKYSNGVEINYNENGNVINSTGTFKMTINAIFNQLKVRV